MQSSTMSCNGLWKPADVEFVFNSYHTFEKKLLDIQKVIPFHTTQNRKAWSPELVNLFLDICSTIDSISRHVVGLGQRANDSVSVIVGGVGRKSVQVRRLDVVHFELNFWHRLRIMDKRIVVYARSLYPNCAFQPFQGYRGQGGWWSTYNNLKHSRVAFYTHATQEKTVRALGALFLILTSYLDDKQFTLVPLYLGWLAARGYVPEYVYTERQRTPGLFWYDTYLFGVSGADAFFPSADITKVNPAVTSQRFQRFIGRFN